MLFKRFSASGESEVELTVPAPYKILCGGVSLCGYALLTASYPESATKWVCQAIPLHRDATVIVNVLAFEDKDDIIDVSVIENCAKGTVTVLRPTEPQRGGDGADDGTVVLCGGASVEDTCLTACMALPHGEGWCASAEGPRDYVTAHLLVARPRDPNANRITVSSTMKGSWRVNIDGVGDAATFLGAARGQNPVAQSMVLNPPSQYSLSHPWKATPKMWCLSRTALEADSLHEMTKTYCHNTKKKSPRLPNQKFAATYSATRIEKA
eukprot:PhM_4_TR15988/c0_g1_i1/m.41630